MHVGAPICIDEYYGIYMNIMDVECYREPVC